MANSGERAPFSPTPCIGSVYFLYALVQFGLLSRECVVDDVPTKGYEPATVEGRLSIRSTCSHISERVLYFAF